MEEIWKDIPGYEGYYQVSTFGRVRSVDRTVYDSVGRVRHLKGQLKKLSKLNDGYIAVSLCLDGIEKHVQVHRLIAITFIPNSEHKPQVNHKDGNKTNNSVDNLEWVTAKENTEHASRTGLRESVGYENGHHNNWPKYEKSRCRPVVCEEIGQFFRSIASAAAWLGVNSTSLDQALKETRPCKGYTFKFVE